MTDHELLLVIYNDVQSMKDELETVKKDVKHLKSEYNRHTLIKVCFNKMIEKTVGVRHA